MSLVLEPMYDSTCLVISFLSLSQFDKKLLDF